MAMMNNDENNEIRWEVINPQGRYVVLKMSTYTKHIIGDHSSEDAKVRKENEQNAKQTIISPNVIVKDETSRHLYYNAVVINDDNHASKIKLFKVIVDSDRVPNEVVTWTTLRRGEKVGNGAIIYERGKDGLSCQ